VLQRYLMHERLIVRFVALLGTGLIALYASWTLAYVVLPDGALRGRTATAALASSEAAGSVALEFARIAAINLVAVILFVVLPNRMLHVGAYPLGYLPPLLWFIHYGALLGSNSFLIEMPGRLAPSLAVFSRSGPYEIAAYCLVAASTHAIAVARSPSLFSLRSEPVEPRPRLSERVNSIGLALALVILLAACLWEAYRIVSGA